MNITHRLFPSIAAGALLALTAHRATASLLITEVMSSGGTVDWFELTNTGPFTLSLAGFKMDDNSFAFATAVPLLGVDNIAPNESVIFLESASSAEPANFRNFWGGTAVAAQVGTYSGSGVGLASGGDGVVVFNSTGVEQTRVSFGVASTGISFGYDPASYPSQSGFGALSSAGSNGAFVSANAAANVGSPGVIPEPASAGLAALGAVILMQRRRRAACAAA